MFMNRFAFNWHSLKTKIVLATLAIFLTGIWSLAFYSERMLRKDIEALLSEQQFATASIVASHVNRELESRVATLQEAARLSSYAMQAGPEVMQAYLEQRWELQPLFNSGSFAIGLDGRATAAIPLSSGRAGIDYTDRAYFSTLLKEGKPTISDPIMGKMSKTAVIVVAVPIFDGQGKMIGALAGVIDMARPNFLDEIAGSRHGKTGGLLLVVPQQRMVATATDKSRVMERLPAPGVNPLLDRFVAGYEGSGVTINSHGVEMLASAKGIPVTGWYVTVTLPTAVAFAPIHDMQQRILLATLILTLLAALTIWWVLQHQLAPLLATARTLAGMSDPEQTLTPLPIVRRDEIGELVGGFNRLLLTLAQREALLKQIMDASSVAIFLVDIEGRLTQANRCMADMFGMPLEQLLGSEYVSLVHPSQRDSGRQKMLALLSSEIVSVDLDRKYLRADETEFWGHLSGSTLYGAEGEKLGLVGVIADINQRKLAEEKLQLAASVFTHAREGITITSADGTIIDVNEAFSRITGYSHDEAVGGNPRLLKSNHHPPEFYANLWRELTDKGHWAGEIWNRRKSGDLYVELLTISAVCDEQGTPQHYVALFTDITPLKEHERQLEYMAHYDMLTTLPNRVLLADRLRQAMAQADRRGQLVAVAYLDLDGFKAVNDTHGHKTGDQLLIALASLMKQALRESDTLARLGGDEFVAVLSDLDDISACMPMLLRLQAAAAHQVKVEGLELQVSASLGVTFYPQVESVDADLLLRQADQAMYQAKLAGRNRYHLFNAEQDRSIRGRNESLDNILHALNAGEFVLYYQPKVNMRTGEIVGAEALIRWQHPERGLLPPSVFLPVIENDPLGIKVGEWVIDSALRQMQLWRDAGLDLPVSVNIGANQLQQRDFVLSLRHALTMHPALRPGDLELEILETSALEDLARVSQIIEDCQELGVRFSLDDFGTGYSSLTYLKRLAVNQLKIDQSFVRDMLDDPDDLTILEGIISLATAFRREVIAEGVETIEHGTLLLQLGCELAQGYGIGRPMPADALLGWVKTWQPDPAWKDLAPVSPAAMPVLLAGTEHRAWVNALERYLQGEAELPPPLDIHKCHFGQWLDGEIKTHPAAQDLHQSVDSVHRQVHAVAEELCALYRQGNGDQALARRPELEVLRLTLVEQLRLMVQHAQH
jgi:diguanylate cyclase (GGDEF)-like protein/PAS domain S-box-containing protein